MLKTLWDFCKQQHAAWVVDFVLLLKDSRVLTPQYFGDVQNLLCVHTVCFVLTHCMQILLFSQITIVFGTEMMKESEYTAPCSRFVMHIKSQVQITLCSLHSIKSSTV